MIAVAVILKIRWRFLKEEANQLVGKAQKNDPMKILSIKCTFVFATLLLILPQAQASDDVKFSLTLGMTLAQVQGLASEMTEVLSERNISIYAAQVSPSDHQTAEAYRLMFSNGKLVKLRVTYKKIVNDIYGTEGKSEFAELRSQFIRRYGEPIQEIKALGKLGFKAPEEFYVCLSFSKCGEWISRFSTTDINTGIELEGMVTKGKGEITVEEEGIPAFRDALDLYIFIGWFYSGLIGGAGGGGLYFLILKTLQFRKKRMLLGQSKTNLANIKGSL